MLRGPGGEGAHTEWAVLNLGPWGLACGPAGRRELGRAGPAASCPGEPALTWPRQWVRTCCDHDRKGPGSLCSAERLEYRGIVVPSGPQPGWYPAEKCLPP